jgi:hypothetical protein
MQLVDTPQFQSLNYSVSTENTTIKSSSSSKLSMVWVQEFDGEKYRLVAKWIPNH